MQTDCFIIAEVGQAHDGSLGQAHAFIDAIARTGASAVKFQTHLADYESSPDEPFRVPFSYEDKTRYDYWRRMEFTPEQWAGLKSHAEEKGLMFMSSPFSVEAAELLQRLGIEAWKVGSGELASLKMLDLMAGSGKPTFISSGMSSYAELEAIVARFRQHDAAFTLLQCTTKYPTAYEDVGLNVMEEFRRRFACPVGLSDHSASIYPSLAAATLGADALEIHVTMSRDMFGPDTKASVTVEELKMLADGVRAFETMLRHPVDKDAAANELKDLKSMFGKSAYARHALPAGHVLSRDDVVMLKPGGGMTETDVSELVGKRMAVAVAEKTRLQREDVAE